MILPTTTHNLANGLTARVVTGTKFYLGGMSYDAKISVYNKHGVLVGWTYVHTIEAIPECLEFYLNE